MLIHLQINNFVLIKSFKNQFNSGFTTITGETGSGKSLFLKALDYVTGKRLDINTEKNIKDKSDIVATFDIKNNKEAIDFLEDRDLYIDDSCILRRVIKQDGKNNAYINNVKVPLKELAELSKYLIEIHSQNSNLDNIDEENHTSIFDSYIDSNDKTKYENNLNEIYKEYKSYQDELNLLQKENENNLSNYQLLEYKYNEIKNLNIEENEYQKLESELQDLENAEKYIENSIKIKNLLDGEYNESEISSFSILKDIKNSINLLNQEREGVKSLQLMSEEIYNTLTEMVNTATSESESFDIDEERLSYVRERMSEINSFSKKNNVFPEEIYEYAQKIISEYEQTTAPTNNIEELEVEIQKLKEKWYEEAEKVSEIRNKNIDSFNNYINETLKDLKMTDAKFTIELKDLSYKVNPYGLEKIVFKISPNLGQDYQDIKTLSGGESSRLNLALKASINKNQKKTLIFDEIDAGIGGKTANSIGKYMHKISKTNQVIAITHLHQVALYSDYCFTVNKNPKNSENITNIVIEKLTDSDFIIELGRMLGHEYINNQRIKEIKNLISETKKI